MRRTEAIWGIGLWAVFAGSALAQVSTSSFPPPPPLTSPQRVSPNQSIPNSTGTLAPPPNVPGQMPNGAIPGTNPLPAGDATGSNSPITAATLTSMTALDDKITLEAGDRISFRVLEDQDDAVPRIVTDTGEVDFPYVGRVKVSGKTCHQVAVELKQLLEVDYYKRATVIVGLDIIVGQGNAAAAARDLVWLMGQVRQVGPQEISKLQPVTVSQVILRAGGFGDFADQRRVKVIHRGANVAGTNAPPPADVSDNANTVIVDVKAVYEGESKVDPVVMPNDYIVVPKKFVNF